MGVAALLDVWGRSWAGPERGSEILCVLTHGMGSTPPPPLSIWSLYHGGAETVTAVSLCCEGIIGEAVEQKAKLCNEQVTVIEITYHGDRVSAGGGCEASVTQCKMWVRYA